ncbi:hypothetical protein BKA82DRAFT_1002464 [Pisolithus tinctorius]|uniref:LYC1 C-terminal domain-containing protein n=1 Tax=Pisolithus tinctorius Marx 270 TaxID=870435 RepID=A0A0C3P4R8_PISTI|nr:hypothetical protein BKA82DRAFT_1002464 [Pisolithus tinctorius]KIO02441.1 hypothetical protein M404DRAFT_1002464 [Pisolithus tinctorius Marx 270]
MDLSSLSLFPATPEQVLISRRRTWPQWGGKLTEEQYLERDRQMDAMEHASHSKLITWVLAPRDNPTTLNFMCSCETFRRRGLVRYLGSNEQQSGIQEVTCYGIASVYTPLDKRRRGYASHMMRLLHWVLSGRGKDYNLPEFPVEWGQPPPEVDEAGKGLFSALYNDIGGQFYQKAGPGLVDSSGWEARDPISTVWEVPQEPFASQSCSGFTWLKYEDLGRLWTKDVQLIKRSIADMPTSAGLTALVSFLPDEGVASFQINRPIVGTEKDVSMDVWGVEKDHTSTDRPTYAVWSVDTHLSVPTLIVICLRATEETFPDLIHMIQEAARRHGVWKMEIWNLPEPLMGLAAHFGGKTFERDEHLPFIKWYGKGDTADIKWVFNEKFCWC